MWRGIPVVSWCLGAAPFWKEPKEKCRGTDIHKMGLILQGRAGESKLGGVVIY